MISLRGMMKFWITVVKKPANTEHKSILFTIKSLSRPDVCALSTTEKATEKLQDRREAKRFEYVTMEVNIVNRLFLLSFEWHGSEICLLHLPQWS